MRWLASLLLLIPTLATAGVWHLYPLAPYNFERTRYDAYSGQTTLCNPRSDCYFEVTGGAVTEPARISGSVTVSSGWAYAGSNTSDTAEFAFGYKDAQGTRHEICVHNQTVNATPTPEALPSFTCAGGSAAVPVGSTYYVRWRANSDFIYLRAATGILPKLEIDNPTCGVAGDACHCNGICNDANCGTFVTYSGGSDDPDYTACQCSCASCADDEIAGPATLTCVDLQDGLHVRCEWSAQPSTGTPMMIYVPTRDRDTPFIEGPGYITDRFWLDSPPPGNHVYEVQSVAACFPNDLYSDQVLPLWDKYSTRTVANYDPEDPDPPQPVGLRAKGITAGIW
jgi:hypothetical protein